MTQSSPRPGDGSHTKRCVSCHRPSKDKTCPRCRKQRSRKRKQLQKPRYAARDRADVTNPVLDEVLQCCGTWPDSRPDRAGLIRQAARLGIHLTDTQAGALINSCYRISPREKLTGMARLVREQQRPTEPPALEGLLVYLDEFRRRHDRFVRAMAAHRSEVAA